MEAWTTFAPRWKVACLILTTGCLSRPQRRSADPHDRHQAVARGHNQGRTSPTSGRIRSRGSASPGTRLYPSARSRKERLAALGTIGCSAANRLILGAREIELHTTPQFGLWGDRILP